MRIPLARQLPALNDGIQAAGGGGAEEVILVDEARWPHRGRLWAHLVSDADYDELHDFASRLGLPRAAFQGDHYDVATESRERAILLGAAAVTSRELLTRLRSAGLRTPPATRRAGKA
jgi:hypothetical protein